jgi:hypothetical protein
MRRVSAGNKDSRMKAGSVQIKKAPHDGALFLLLVKNLILIYQVFPRKFAYYRMNGKRKSKR